MYRSFPRRRLLMAAAAATSMAAAPGKAADPALRLDFENMPAGSLPRGFTAGLTGVGVPPTWKVIEDPSAPAGSKVLAQTSIDKSDYRFPLAILDAPRPADVDVTVIFKPIAGEVDRAAGIAVRLKDASNYYVVRANALEDNVNFYRVTGGVRRRIKGVDVAVKSGVWHALGLTAEGDTFTVAYDGKTLFRATDRALTKAGRVALWTKADSVTWFDSVDIRALG